MRRSSILAAAAGFLALAFAWTLAIGQAQALITYCLAIRSPLAVAVAANLKVYPILVAVFWVGRRDWRQLGRLAAWMIGLIAFQFVLEPAATLAYIGFLRAEEVADVNNLSLFAVSPVLWAVSVVVLGLVALRLAPTRWGWAAIRTRSRARGRTVVRWLMRVSFMVVALRLVVARSHHLSNERA